MASVPEEKKSVFRITNDVYINQDEFETSKPSVVKDLNGITGRFMKQYRVMLTLCTGPNFSKISKLFNCVTIIWIRLNKCGQIDTNMPKSGLVISKKGCEI